MAALLMMPAHIFAQSNAQEEQPQNNQQSQPDTLRYTVYGMDCPGCEGGLEKQVDKIPAVKSSKGNWVKQELQVIVKPDSSLRIRELKKRVKKANFTLDMNTTKEEDE